MPKHALSFIELHNHFFMQGSNLGNKINAAQRGAKIFLDDERQVVWVYYKSKVSFIPLASVASADAVQIPQDIQELLEVQLAPEAPLGGPPAIRRGRGRPPTNPEPITQPMSEPVPYPDFDPNDAEAAARHKALVWAASANANRPSPTQNNDDLIQQSRNAAMGIKHQRTSQVQTAQQVGEMASVTPKRKIISHAELKAETKE